MRTTTTMVATFLVACWTVWIADVPSANAQAAGARVQTPAGNAQISGGGAQVPGPNAQIPSANLGASGLNTQTSGANAQVPGANVQTPGANVQVPGADVQVPGANLQTPGLNARVPSGDLPVVPGVAVGPNAINGGPLFQAPDSWRYRQHNGQWWYWTPANNWMVWSNNQWGPYNAGVIREPYTTGYRGVDGNGYINGYNNGYYYGGRYYGRPARRARRWGY